MTSKLILTASVAAIALAVGSFAVAGDAFARGGGGGGGGHGGHGGSSRSAMSSVSFSKSSSSMKMSSSHKHRHHHHHRKRSYIGGLDGCDGYYKNGVCIEDDDED
jgi:hypothetical protein